MNDRWQVLRERIAGRREMTFMRGISFGEVGSLLSERDAALAALAALAKAVEVETGHGPIGSSCVWNRAVGTLTHKCLICVALDAARKLGA